MGNEFVTITSPDVAALVHRINTNASAPALRKDLNKGLKRVTMPIRAQMKAAIPSALPRRGGLAGTIQRATRSRTDARGGSNAGVRMVFWATPHDIRLLMGKQLRHPVYGDRADVVTQTAGVHPDVFSEMFAKQKPQIQRAVTDVLNDIARKVTS